MVAHATVGMSKGAATVVVPEWAAGVVGHTSQDPAMAEGPEQTHVMVVVELAPGVVAHTSQDPAMAGGPERTHVMVVVELVRHGTGQSSSMLCRCVEALVSLVLATLRLKKLPISVPACQHCWVVMLLLALLLS